MHDPVLEHNAELVSSVCAAASLTLENERLQAELRARLLELQASRARLVRATDAERRRIERDLHDGTQQRLVSIAMSLGLLETKLPDQATAAQSLVRETREALALALGELRELTHGINPPLLTERGLPAALDELCRRAALPTRLEVTIDGRLPDQIETAAYFMVSEALTNAAKHSHGSEIQVFACLPRSTPDHRDRRRRHRQRHPHRRLRTARPRRPHRSARRPAHDLQPTGPRHHPASRDPMRVALADDAVILREGLSRLLEEAGFEVVGLAGRR